MFDLLADAIQEHIPKSIASPLIVSVSGGVDSMVLLHVLHTMDYPLIVAHVNHQRRKASDEEYVRLQRYCKTLEIPFEGTRYEEAEPGNFQANARDFRLEFLKDTARKYGSRLIMTAHHQNDRIESFLMRLSEGRTLNALTSIRPVLIAEGFKIVKPFLSIPKSTLETYAKNHELPYFEDASNQDTIYTRNFIRHELIPRFKEMNASFEASLPNLLDELEEADDLIEKTVLRHPGFHEDTVSLSEFLSLSPLLKRRFLKRKIQTYLPDYHPSKKELNALIQTIDLPNNAVVPLKKGYALHKEYQVFFIRRQDDDMGFSIKITGPGLFAVPDGSTLEISNEKKVRNLTKVFELWYNDDVYPLYLRHRRDGDRIRFNYGHKKIKDLFIDLKIPPHKRNKILLLCDDKNNVLWIPSLDLKAVQDEGANPLYLHFHDAEDQEIS